MKKIIALLLAAAMLATFAACTRQDIQQHLDAKLDGTDFSGVVLMTQNGRTVCEAAGGVENSKTQEPITIDTLFCIGSVSKQFAAGAILLLQQDGKLSVDDPLGKYYPGYPHGGAITLRHMLDMRSGIPEFYDVEYIDGAFTELPTGELRGVITNQKTAAENRQTLENWLMKQPLDFKPDTDFAYCNSNYFLLARIVEKVSGKSYSDFVRERIFEPLDMTHSTFVDDVKFKDVPHLAAPTVRPQTVYVGVTMGLGDMISNARDIDRWLTSLKTHAILSEENVALMSADYTDSDDEDYGFGLRPWGEGMYHSGSITTYQAMAYTDPESGINIFTVTNDDPNPDNDVSAISWDLVEQMV